MNDIAIRPVDPADAAAIRDIYAPIVEDTAISFEIEVPSVAEISARITAITATYPWFVAVSAQDAGVIGYVYASAHHARAAYRWSVDVTVYIHGDWRGRNVGRQLCTTLFDALREQGFVMAYAGITLPNAGSVGLHEAMGFEPVGTFRQAGYKLGAWHDVGYWQLQLTPLPRAPREFPR
ncbi:MAG: arsinothricin resistance N-acetyltransferase ArsN1 family B [Acidimicrobiia bacterium]